MIFQQTPQTPSHARRSVSISDIDQERRIRRERQKRLKFHEQELNDEYKRETPSTPRLVGDLRCFKRQRLASLLNEDGNSRVGGSSGLSLPSLGTPVITRAPRSSLPACRLQPRSLLLDLNESLIELGPLPLRLSVRPQKSNFPPLMPA